VETILKRVKSTVVSNFRSNPWMDVETRQAAIRKSKKIKGLVGFPSYIKNEVLCG
jgi:predicted metalloendopeptidase